MNCASACARLRSISSLSGPSAASVAISSSIAVSSSASVRPGAAVATTWKKPPISREFWNAAISVAIRRVVDQRAIQPRRLAAREHVAHEIELRIAGREHRGRMPRRDTAAAARRDPREAGGPGCSGAWRRAPQVRPADPPAIIRRSTRSASASAASGVDVAGNRERRVRADGSRSAKNACTSSSALARKSSRIADREPVIRMIGRIESRDGRHRRPGRTGGSHSSAAARSAPRRAGCRTWPSVSAGSR